MAVPTQNIVYQPRPSRTYYLDQIPNVTFNGAWGLGMPRMSTADELVLERSVFQHGSNLTIVRLPPTREFTMRFSINEACDDEQYRQAREDLLAVFNPIHLCNAQVGGVIPGLYRYTMMRPGGWKRHIDFAYRSGLEFDEGDAEDLRSFDLKVNLMAPHVTLYGDNQQIEINGFTSAVGGTYNDILNPFTPPFVYSGSWPARFTLDFERSGAPSISTLYALILRDVTNSFSYVFKHEGYPATGWTFGGVVMPQVFAFDSKRETFTYSDAGPNSQNLTLAAHADSDWRDFQFYPGVEYEIYLETDTALRLVTGISPDGLNYNPTYVGV